MRRQHLTFVASVLVSIGLLYYVCRQVDVRLALAAIADAQPGLLVLAFVFMITAYSIRGARWLIWDRALTYGRALRATFVGFMGNNVLPARLGEILRADWIAQRSPAQFGRTATLASIAAERILDGIVLSLFAAIGLLWIEANPIARLSLLGFIGSFALLGVVLILSISHAHRIRDLLDRVNRFFPGHVTRFTKAKANHALDGLMRLQGSGRLSSAVAATAAIWTIEAAFYWTVAAAIHPISIGTSVALLAVTNFASLFPLTTGGIGAIEGASTALLVSLGVPPSHALAIVLVQHMTQLVFTTAVGGWAYFSDRVPVSSAGGGTAVDEAPDEDVLARTRLTIDELRTDLALEAPVYQPVLLSIVIPAYNERHRLPRTVLETIRWCGINRIDYELIIVDDGSTDDTLAIAKLLEDQDRRVRCIACPHKGKGMAVRVGMLNARGGYVLFMDADGATPLSEIPKLLNELKRGSSVAIGSRIAQGPCDVTVTTSLHRKVIGRVFAFLVNLFAVEGIADTQCGFKMFPREVIKAVFSRQKLDGFAFDVEILFIARQLGLSIGEIPVNWQNQPGSKVNLIADSIQMLWDLTRIRWLHRREAAIPRAAMVTSTDRALT